LYNDLLEKKIKMRNRSFKRLIDIVGSLIGLALSSPLIIVISIVIYFTMGRPIFFKQVRPGLNGKPFVIYKFRTMLDLRDEKGYGIKN
jgi:lipopolysaccharide/colanic/teichoic acid biosynthesis glycosyltransferase